MYKRQDSEVENSLSKLINQRNLPALIYLQCPKDVPIGKAKKNDFEETQNRRILIFVIVNYVVINVYLFIFLLAGVMGISFDFTLPSERKKEEEIFRSLSEINCEAPKTVENANDMFVTPSQDSDLKLSETT